MLTGIMLVIDPEIIFGFLRKNTESLAIHVIAVLTRLVVGALLIAQSHLSIFQLEVEILGWVLIVAGFLLVAIGQKKFQKLMSQALGKSKLFGRLSGVLSITFGAFLIYAFYR